MVDGFSWPITAWTSLTGTRRDTKFGGIRVPKIAEAQPARRHLRYVGDGFPFGGELRGLLDAFQVDPGAAPCEVADAAHVSEESGANQ
ncbi:hypothetical protein ACPSM1_10220 [Micromonospora chersina]|uniref:hypothetical protein n=1 Tax=Micromonospora chersina TaxID=47854 RepID=UPI003C961784